MLQVLRLLSVSRIGVFAALLLICSVSKAQVQEYWAWGVNKTPAPRTCAGSTQAADCPTAATLVRVGSVDGVTFRNFGRTGAAISVDVGSGPYNVEIDQAISNTHGFAWMAFVWVDEFQPIRQGVLWQEGYDPEKNDYAAGFAITIDETGVVHASVGQGGGNWAFALSSADRVGRSAWHHVALVWDTKSYYLFLNGRLQSSMASVKAPDTRRRVPVTFGAFFANGAPLYILNGALDEVKFVKFPVGTFTPSGLPSENFVLRERGLAFRNTVFADLVAAGVVSPGAIDTFASPSHESTSILRAWVNSFFTRARVGLPLDPLRVDSEDYVFPLAGEEGRPSMYKRLRDGVNTGYCGAASIALRGVYKAFGYPARIVDWMNDTDLQYTDSHAVVEVMTVQNQYLLQDPTYNISGYDAASAKYWSILDLHYATEEPPAILPFNDGNFDYNHDPVWTLPTSLEYFSYFKWPARISNAWTN